MPTAKKGQEEDPDARDLPLHRALRVLLHVQFVHRCDLHLYTIFVYLQLHTFNGFVKIIEDGFI